MWWIDWMFVIVGVLWLGVAVWLHLGQRAFQSLPLVDVPDSNVGVSVVLPVRDDVARIEGTVQRYVEQQGVDVEVILIDDRSGPANAEILAELAGRHPAVKLLRIEELPADWLGKTHACHRGAAMATGEWLLFTDSDAWCEPDTLARAVAGARRFELSYLSLAPGYGECTVGGKAVLLVASMALLKSAFELTQAWIKASFGVGAFGLVSRSAYDASGGHAALRMEVVDDVRLCASVRQSGGRCRIFRGFSQLQVHWASSVGSFVQILEKNFFAVFDFSVLRLVVAVLAIVAFWLVTMAGPLVAVLQGRWLPAFAGVGVLVLWRQANWIAGRLGWRTLPVVLAPVIVPVIPWAMVNSAWKTLRTDGVTWRDTRYPLSSLRRAVRSRRSNST